MSKSFLFILIVTFIVIIIWVAANIYHTKPSEPVSPDLQTLLDPIDPNFNASVLEKVKNNAKTIITPPIPVQTQASPSPIPATTPTATITQEATPSSEISSPSGTLR